MVYVNQWLIILLIFIAFMIGIWLGMGVKDDKYEKRIHKLEYRLSVYKHNAEKYQREYNKALAYINSIEIKKKS